MFQMLKRAWMPLLLVVVISLGAYAVVRIRDTFGANAAVASGDGNADNTKPFNPKHITYEITGASGGSVDVDFLEQISSRTGLGGVLSGRTGGLCPAPL